MIYPETLQDVAALVVIVGGVYSAFVWIRKSWPSLRKALGRVLIALGGKLTADEPHSFDGS